MVDFARSEARAEAAAQPLGLVPSFLKGDMCSPAGLLPGTQYDIVTCLYGSLGHCDTLGAAAAAFDAAAALLAPGGVFVVELDHPRLLFDGSVAHAAQLRWDVPHADGSLRVRWGAAGDDFDPLSQVLRRTVSVELLRAVGGGPPAMLLVDCVPARLFTASELGLLAARAGLVVAAAYGALDEDSGAADADAERLVLVFQRDTALDL
jgi:SAM-dependent methyltransferase